ncbi:MAG TPA: site-specific DNA-methyltransferase [Thermoanaerobaculia bacterium]|nr:site-specific DNA-methyltransferase [Thermoanaerobaculia bacterium]
MGKRSRPIALAKGSPEGEPLYTTALGSFFLGDSLKLMKNLEDESVDLVVTSPPFALLREKEYGNKDQSDYVSWLCQFGREVLRTLKPSGSFVLDLGGAYQRGVPVRSLYNFEVLLRLCKEERFFLAEEFFWYNPAKLPSPIEWVNKRKIRAKDAVNTIWWLSKTEYPKANVSNVLAPYSKRMQLLLKDAKKFYTPKDRPSGHGISASFDKDNGGSIPSNLLQIPNTESNSSYIRLAKEFDLKVHPARFPKALPDFFIRFLTEPGDTVLDIFAGSNTTGESAEENNRRWMSFEIEKDYAIASALRFMDDWPANRVRDAVKQMEDGFRLPAAILPLQPALLSSLVGQ